MTDQPPTPNVVNVVVGGEPPLLDDPAETFFEASKLHPELVMTEAPGLLAMERNPALVHASANPGRSYGHRPTVSLPAPVAPEGQPSLDEMLRRRASPMSFRRSASSPTLEQIAYWCWATDGETHRVGDLHRGRTAPSGGALFPRDLYVVTVGTEGLEAGLHHYDPYGHELAHLSAVTLGDLGMTTPQPELFATADLCLIVTCCFWRSRVKYGQRAVRFALIEAGHVAQNALLAVGSHGYASKPIGGFDDDRLADLLGLDGVNDAPVYLLPVGQPSDA